jgi:hypothetical protein
MCYFQRASDQRLVMCTCVACKANPGTGLHGRMIPARKRRTHQEHEGHQSTVPAFKNRGKRGLKGGHARSRGRGGLINVPSASQALMASQAGPSHFDEADFGDPDVPDDRPEVRRTPAFSQAGGVDEADPVIIPEGEELNEPSVDAGMSDVRTIMVYYVYSS